MGGSLGTGLGSKGVAGQAAPRTSSQAAPRNSSEGLQAGCHVLCLVAIMSELEEGWGCKSSWCS